MRELTQAEEQAIREKIAGIPEDDLLAFVVSGDPGWVASAFVFQQELRVGLVPTRAHGFRTPREYIAEYVENAPGVCFDCEKAPAPERGERCAACAENAAAEESPLSEANQ